MMGFGVCTGKIGHMGTKGDRMPCLQSSEVGIISMWFTAITVQNFTFRYCYASLFFYLLTYGSMQCIILILKKINVNVMSQAGDTDEQYRT